MTKKDFYTQICNFPEKYENRDLEDYLLALYSLVEVHKTETINAGVLIDFLSKAFSSDPVVFQDEWLSHDTAPHESGITRKFTNPEIKNDFDRDFRTNIQGVEFTSEVLRFQIAELHKMRGKQLEDQYRYFGIRSETGNEWYNFDPFSLLECGMRCEIDNSESEDEEMPVTWQTLGILLEDGRIYE